MIKAPADGSPVDDPAKLCSTSSATSRRVCSPVGADLGLFVYLLKLFLFFVVKTSLFRKWVFLITNDGCGPKYKGCFYWTTLLSVPTKKLLQSFWPTDIIIIKNVYIQTYVPSRNLRHFCGLLNSFDTFITPFLRSMANSALNRLKHKEMSLYSYFIIINHTNAVFKIFTKNLIPAPTIISPLNICNVNEIVISVLCHLMICNPHAV